jgi:hypothetical protein
VEGKEQELELVQDLELLLEEGTELELEPVPKCSFDTLHKP